MSKNVVETITGAVVVAVAVWFLVIFANKTNSINLSSDDYNIVAKFETAEGIAPGSMVKIGGVKIGVITSQKLDPTTYFAVIGMSVDNAIKIPRDSSAKIVSDGLLGAKYVSIVPGGDEAVIKNNGELKYTQSSVNLETLIGKMIFSGGNKGGKKEENSE